MSAYNRTYACARTRAIRSLIDTHREEYDCLLQSQLERRGIVTHEARRQSRRLAQMKMDDKRQARCPDCKQAFAEDELDGHILAARHWEEVTFRYA